MSVHNLRLLGCCHCLSSLSQGYRQRVAFIVTQAPMENTIGDFWRMIWEQKSAAIVMLTELEEGGKVGDSGIALSCQLPALCLLCKPGPH